ncbi:MAG: porin family protein [Bacteroidota bacterium]
MLGVILVSGWSATAQNPNRRTENLINYDQERIHYGFAFGGHSSKYVFKYSDAFVTPSFDTLHSIVNRSLGGFKIGFVVNIRLFQYLDFRVLPTFGLYENELLYRFTNSSNLTVFKDATFLEIPLVFKYKSQRRRNTGMYLVLGVNPSLEAAARGDEEADIETLETKNWNLAIESGIGFDIFFPLFKFSPELRYSWGIRNMLQPEVNQFNAPLEKLLFHNFTFFITFEGGPSYLKRNKRR